MKYTARLTVRTYECDSYGHVNNAIYLNYLEYARMEYLHAIGFDYKGLIASGIYLYVTHIDIYYKCSAYLDDELYIDVVPTKLQAVQGEFLQTIRKTDGQGGFIECALARVHWASVKAGGVPTRIPDKYMVAGLYPDPSLASGSTIGKDI